MASAGKSYGFRSLVPVTSRYPLWEVEGIDRDIEAGRGYLTDAPTGEREALVTGPITAEPEQIIRLAGPGWTPFVAAAATAVLFTALTLKQMPTALGAGLIAALAYLYWFWTMDKAVPRELRWPFARCSSMSSRCLLVRIGSKRFLSQATAFDVIVAIMLGSILSRAINGSAPLTPTVRAAGALVGLHWVFAALATRTSFFGPLVKGEPRLLIKDGQVQEEEMRRAKLSDHDLE